MGSMARMILILFLFPLFVQAVDLSETLSAIGYRQAPVFVQDRVLQSDDGITLSEKLILHQESVGDIEVYVHRPSRVMTGEKLPVLLVAAGFGTAQKLSPYIKEMGRMVVLTYQYPVPLEPERIHEWLTPDIGNILNRVPGQVVAATQWLYDQSYVDSSRVNLFAVSLGTLFSPLAQRISQFYGRPFRSTILSYGGADMGEMASYWLQKEGARLGFLGEPELRALGEMVRGRVNQWLRFLDPKHHLPFLKGDFLLIYGEQEEVFPPQVILSQKELTPTPKDVIWLPGPHVGLKRPDLIEPLLLTVGDWLGKRGIVDVQ